ncbi:MAG: hypothetical protein KGL53_15485, partial [Elusimicrobia bacterium]|nr:hypothetical protein [Elusimicrobiota bacterium]
MRLAAALLLAAVPAAARTGRPSPAAKAALARGVDAYLGARFDDAVAAMSQALKDDPGWKTAAGLRSICLWTTG